jgi:hypothetical protein
VVAARDCAVLDLSGLPPDTRRLVKDMIDTSRPQDWARAGRVSEQILLMTVNGRPVLTAYRDLFRKPAVRDSLIKAMVYGSVLPGAQSFPGSGRWLETRQSRPIYDRLLSEAAGKVNVPSLEDLVRRIESGSIVNDLFPPEPKPVAGQKAGGQNPR